MPEGPGHGCLCCGYCLSWKGGVYNLRKQMLNVISDKVEYCKEFGIEISAGEWPCNEMHGILITDKGSDFVSDNFAKLAEPGVYRLRVFKAVMQN